jgi:hypothetical protein
MNAQAVRFVLMPAALVWIGATIRDGAWSDRFGRRRAMAAG